VMVVERTLLVDSGVVEGMAVVEVDEAVRPNNLNIVVKNFKVYFGSILHINNLQLCSNFFHFFRFFSTPCCVQTKNLRGYHPPPSPSSLTLPCCVQTKNLRGHHLPFPLPPYSPLLCSDEKFAWLSLPPPTPPPLLSLVVIQRKICVPTNPTPPLPLTLHCCDPTKKFRVY
jgi:hypothetical protein